MSNEDLVFAIQNGNSEFKNELWGQIYKFTRVICFKYIAYAEVKGYELDDLINSAWFGLDKAIMTFDVNKGCKFLTYFRFYAEKEIKKFLGLSTRSGNGVCIVSLDEPIDDDEGLTRLDLLEDDCAEEAYTDAENRDELRWLKTQLDYLPDKERAVITGIFFDNKTQTELSREMEYSFQYISTLQRQALRKLRTNRELRAYYNSLYYRHTTLHMRGSI